MRTTTCVYVIIDFVYTVAQENKDIYLKTTHQLFSLQILSFSKQSLLDIITLFFLYGNFHSEIRLLEMRIHNLGIGGLHSNVTAAQPPNSPKRASVSGGVP